jgi:hypothetical protein
MKIPKIKIKKPPKKWLIFASVSLLSALLAVVCLAMFNSAGRSLRSQNAASAWAGKSGVKYAQISVFAPAGSIDTGKIAGFRQKIKSSVSDTMPEGVKNIYTDAFSAAGKVSIAGDHGSSDASVIAVGGNYFFFHPLTLLSGSYFSESDVMHDRVVLDEELAWKLFGSSNLAGMTVTIDNRPFVVSGVVRRETDKADKAAYDGGLGLYMLYDAYNSLSAPVSTPDTGAASTGTGASTATDTSAGAGTSSSAAAASTGSGQTGSSGGTTQTSSAAITCYEAVLPNPVVGFAAGLANSELNADKSCEVVENSLRYTSGSIFSNVLKNSGKRVMHLNGIEYPYWENAARLVESRCGTLLLLRLIFLLCPAVFVCVMLVALYKYIRRLLKAKFADLKDRYEERTLFSHMKGSDDDGGTDA